MEQSSSKIDARKNNIHTSDEIQKNDADKNQNYAMIEMKSVPFLLVALLGRCHGFQPLLPTLGTLGQLQCQSRSDVCLERRQQQQQQQQQQHYVVNDDGSSIASSHTPLVATVVVSRQRWLRSFLGLGVAAISSGIVSQDAVAAAPPAAGSDQKDTIWLTGKDPVVPGQAPRDKNDVKGTRKDPNFLRSLADCKTQCENPAGSDGLARTKETCLSECQDICCQSYQQCTFGIVPRI
jgi:hypothetical protein